MPTATDEHVTAHTSTAQRESITMSPTTTTLLRIPRRRSLAWLSLLKTLSVPFMKHRQRDMRGTNPDVLRHETLADRVARTKPYLYIHTLSG